MNQERAQFPQSLPAQVRPALNPKEAIDMLNEIGHIDVRAEVWFNNLRELLLFAKAIVHSHLCPEEYQGRPLDAAMAIVYGTKLGLSPFMSLQCVAVVNGRPSIWGDAALAVCRRHPLWVEEAFCEEFIYDKEGRIIGAKCTVQRKGANPITRQFTLQDAQRAGLLEKKGPWRTYPHRMLQMRARSWALRDAFGDALHGISIAEEAQDIERPEEMESEPQQEQHVPANVRAKRLAAKIRAQSQEAPPSEGQSAPQEHEANAAKPPEESLLPF